MDTRPSACSIPAWRADVFKALEAALPRSASSTSATRARPVRDQIAETVSRYGIEAARFLKSTRQDARGGLQHGLVVDDEVAEEARVPVIGVILPGAAPRVKVSKRGGSGDRNAGDGASESYPRAILALPRRPRCSAAVPALRPAGRGGWTDNDVARRVAETYSPLKRPLDTWFWVHALPAPDRDHRRGEAPTSCWWTRPAPWRPRCASGWRASKDPRRRGGQRPADRST